MFVHIHSHQQSKLDPKALKCIFLGYSATQKGYKCYSPTTHRFYVSMDVTFFEHQPFFPKPIFRGRTQGRKIRFGTSLSQIIHPSLVVPVLTSRVSPIQISLIRVRVQLQASPTHVNLVRVQVQKHNLKTLWSYVFIQEESDCWKKNLVHSPSKSMKLT